MKTINLKHLTDLVSSEQDVIDISNVQENKVPTYINLLKKKKSNGGGKRKN